MAELAEDGFTYQKTIVMVGFGCIGQALLPMIFRHFSIHPSRLVIISNNNDGAEIANAFGVSIEIATLTQENYRDILTPKLQEGDFLLNVSVGVSSFELINLCQEKGALYLDTCTEPWDGAYTDTSLVPAMRTNYALREQVLTLKKPHTSTALITHGANPGLISHFVKQALWNMAQANGIEIQTDLSNAKDWAQLAYSLNVNAIQIAERDTQITNKIKSPGEFVNTWSVDGFVAEGSQPAELGWGTHERHWPLDGNQHEFGSKCAIYLDRPGAGTKVRTWVPSMGPAHGYLITHAESISIANYLTLSSDEAVHYRPTVHYAYIPCPDAILSLHELASNDWHQQPKKRLISDEITEGKDELGVLLMGHKNNAYWYGSSLSIDEARRLVPYNNATSLQVVMGVIAGMQWVIEHPDRGLLEPEDIDYKYILNIAEPYLGVVSGHYTNWTPLQRREKLFKESLDHSDPWQFLNIRVSS